MISGIDRQSKDYAEINFFCSKERICVVLC